VPLSQYKGVAKYKNSAGEDLYRVIIKATAKGVAPAKYIRINGFKCEDDAARAYNKEIVKLRGKWAWLNPVPDKTDVEVG